MLAHAQKCCGGAWFPGADQAEIAFRVMASGKKSFLLSSLADYGDDSEPDSEPDIEETGKIYYKLLSSKNWGEKTQAIVVRNLS